MANATKDKTEMADEKPRKTRKTTARAPRKQANGYIASEAAAIGTGSTGNDAHNAEAPRLSIEQSSEVNRPDSIDEIRREAYELYVSRGGGDGNDLSDWLEAERIVRSRRTGAGEATDRNQR